MSHGRKCWLVYSPNLNRIFVSRNVTFDETLFPLKGTDQRVFGKYDNQSVQQLRASAYGLPEGNETEARLLQDILELPLPASPESPMVNLTPTEAPTPPHPDELLSQAPTQPDPIFNDDPTVPCQATPPSHSGSDDGGGTASHPGGGSCSADGGGSGSLDGGGSSVPEASSPHHGGPAANTRNSYVLPRPTTLRQAHNAPAAASSAAGELRPAKQPRFAEAPPAYGVAPSKWWDCEHEHISATSDERLAEYLIGHSIQITFPEDFWPRDHGQWVGEAFDTTTDSKHFPGKTCLKVLLTSGPKKRRFGEHAVIPLSNFNFGRGHTDVSVRRALREQFPKAVHCRDLTAADGDKAHVKLINRRPRAAKQKPASSGTGYGKIAINPDPSPQAALLTFATLYMLESHQMDFAFTSEFNPIEPKSQRDAMQSPQCDEWKRAEEIELKTIWDMGTFEVVDRPLNIPLLPSRFTYRVKRNKDGSISKFKARLVARGDMQTEDEYSTTFAPTSRFTAIRTIISLACQERMTLKHWDISGAFMCADIDTEIYLEMPPGYRLPEGKAIKLKKSLYGLR